MKLRNLLSIAFLPLVFCSSVNADKSSAIAKGEQFIEDSVITANIKTQYSTDTFIDGTGPNTTTNKGIVTLKGNSATHLQADRAENIAKAVNGVQAVNTQGLKVSDSKDPLADAAITAKVKSYLTEIALTSSHDLKLITNVHVETKNGVVYLLGDVPNSKVKEDILNYANQLKGIKAVRGLLYINS